MDLSKNIEDFDLIILDLETTGLDVVTGDSICEIGAFKVKDRKIVDKFHSLINPRKTIPQEAYRIHKISDEELKDAPYFEDVAAKLILFLEESVVCAYNVGFDMGFINNHLMKIDQAPLNLPAIDILAMARDALSLSQYNLKTVAGFFKIDCSQGLHRALDDALVAYQVFSNLIDIFKGKGIDKLEEFLSLYGFRNDIFKLKEDEKLLFLKDAIDKKVGSKIRYFSSANIIEEETILPLRVFEENRCFCLLYQGKDENSFRIRLDRILNIKPV